MSDLRTAAEKVLWAIKNRWEIGPDDVEEAMHSLYEALKKPKQKPVMWMNKDGHVSSKKNKEYSVPLYAEPKVWRGFEDDEIPGEVSGEFCKGALWAEEILREKNQ